MRDTFEVMGHIHHCAAHIGIHQGKSGPEILIIDNLHIIKLMINNQIYSLMTFMYVPA